MKVGLLTSSRADFGIYHSLIEKLESDDYFNLEIIAFGTHLSKYNGYTVDEIRRTFPSISIKEISSLLSNDDPESIATSYGLTTVKFAAFWNQNSYDLVFCLGDRFEMNAAVQTGIPFGIKFAHLHGGETTLGAIDNIYRHQITLASSIHFTSTENYSNKIKTLLDAEHAIHYVGSLSLDNLEKFVPSDKNNFYNQFGIESDFALVTFHPETVSFEKNITYAEEIGNALLMLSESLTIVITMPNADTLGTLFRDSINKLKEQNPSKVILIENFGKQNYFTAMKYCKLLIGNTSSGIIEAASFNKYVINVGNRQKGRQQSKNCYDVEFNALSIVKKAKELINKGDYSGDNVYYQTNVANKIIKIIKENEKF